MSLRRRLRRVLFVLLAGLALQWLMADRMLVHVGESEMATRLQHDADSLASAITTGPQQQLLVDARVVGVMYGRLHSGHYFVLRSGTQRVASSSLGSFEPLAREPAGGEEIDHVPGPAGQPLLALFRRLRLDGQDLHLTVAEDLTTMHGQLLEFRLMFLAASVLLLAAALLMQRREIQAALKPVDAARDAILQLQQEVAPVVVANAPEELQPLIDEVNRLMAHVEHRLHQSRTSIANLSHALKTPLAGLVRLLDDPGLQAQPELRRSMQQQAEVIRQRVERELKRARLAGERHAGTRFMPSEELKPLVQLLHRIHGERELAIEWTAPDKAVAMDREDLLELIGNLADNACKWAASKVRITLLAGATGLDIVVADDGPGCTPELLQQLGQRGLRSDESKPGHGLGLSIVRDIADAMGGSLHFSRSATLGGLEVRVHLPWHGRAEPAALPPAAPAFRSV